MSISEILSKQGCRITKPRRAVLEALKKHQGIISAQKLAKKVRDIDRASVYRALNLFAELGAVNVEIIGKEKLYCLAGHPHHHIICRRCGYIEDFPCTNLEFKKFKNFIDIEHRLTLTGLCRKCSK